MLSTLITGLIYLFAGFGLVSFIYLVYMFALLWYEGY